MVQKDSQRAIRWLNRAFCLLVAICWQFGWHGSAATAFEPASNNLARQIVSESGVAGGLVVHVGSTTGQLTAALRIDDRYTVQGLARTVPQVRQARTNIRSQNDDGRVSVAGWHSDRLPFVDNLVNLLVVTGAENLSMEEILRVLSPGGVAMLHQDPGNAAPAPVTRHEFEDRTWWKLSKPWPADVDQWTHYLHGPDNNAVARDTVVGPPRHMQWSAGPEWSRNHHILASVSSVVSAGGRIFAVVDHAPAANINIPAQWSIVARDAFSGVTLWKKPMPIWAWHRHRFRSGPPQMPRLMVASEKCLFCPLELNAPISSVDAQTGQTLNTFPETEGAEEILLVDQTLVVLKGAPVAEHAVGHARFRDTYRHPNRKTLLAVNSDTGQLLWQWSDSAMHPLPETLAADGRRVYLQCDTGLVAIDLQSGNECWRHENQDQQISRKRVTFGKHTLVVADDVVLCKLNNQLTALSARDGTPLWDCPAGNGFHAPLDIFVIDGLVWTGDHGSDSISPPPRHDFHAGRDLHTGEIKRTNQVAVNLQTAGHHHRCYREKATSRFIITGKRGIELMDLSRDDHSRNNWVRGGCQYGVLPANGLLYALPHACGCYMESKLRGFWALSSSRSDQADRPESMADVARLETAANDQSTNQSTDKSFATKSTDWPTYRHDALRSGVASTSLATTLRPTWQTRLGGRLTQPVVAGQRVVLASIDRHTVFALDQQTGKLQWQFAAGGRIDSPPTIHDGKVLFGSADGRLTCLNLRDGAVIWQFFAAPADLRTVAYNQVESVWPVHGSPLVLDDVVYCSAGRSTWLDGGIDLYGLDPATGTVRHHHRFASQHPRYLEGKHQENPDLQVEIVQNLTDYKTFHASDRSDAFSMQGGTISDVLVSDGHHVFLHQVAFDTQLNRLETMKRHLFSTSSLLDSAENHRSHWVLGTGDFSRIGVAYSWIVNGLGKWKPGIAVPTGVMMVFQDHSLWGIRRTGNSTGEYVMFQKPNQPFSPDEPSQPDFRRVPAAEAQREVWQRKLPVRPTAMLAAGDYLYLSTTPVTIPTEDPSAAYAGRLGGSLWICSQADGKPIAKLDLESPAVWDGMAAAAGKLFVSTVDGRVICLQ